MHNASYYKYPKLKFLMILLTQLSILSVALIFTAAANEGILPLALIFYQDIPLYGLLWEIGLLLMSCLFQRLCVNTQHSTLLIASLVLYTTAGSLLMCHLASLLLCHVPQDDVVGGDAAECLASSSSVIRGQNAVCIGSGLLVPCFILIHLINYRGEEKHPDAEEMGIRAILITAVMVIFITCGIICIIDDSVWDWKYAYAFLFSLCISAYLSGFSTFIVFNDDQNNNNNDGSSKTNHYLHITALFFLQPFLFVEASVKKCLSI